MHGRARGWVALLLSSLAACASEPAPHDDVEVGARPPDDRNGQTTSIGSSPNECTQDSDCIPRAEAELAALAQPTRSARMFESGVCTQLGVITAGSSVNGRACQCKQGSGFISIGPVGLGCYALGRAGDCLWGDSEFSGCKLDETEECTAMCSELEKRFADDAARTFTGHVRYTQCDTAATICHNVVEIEGRCYADRSYGTGHDYSCELSDEEILEQHLAPPAPDTSEPIETASQSLYLPEANGFLQLTAATSFTGSVGGPTHFGTMAQFYSVDRDSAASGTVIDPLDGLDDCGISTGASGAGPAVKLLDVDSAALVDGDRELPLELFRSSSNDYYSYSLDLSDHGVTPRFDADYGFRASGGRFAGTVDLKAIHLPAELAIHALEGVERVPQGALRLTWSGRNDAPLGVYMTVRSTLGNEGQQYRIDCLLRDDGEFEIPASVLGVVTNGFVTAELTRENRALAHSGGKTIVTSAQVRVAHELALGESCERDDVMEACLKYAEQLRASYAGCSTAEAPSVESICPAYLREACAGCSEYFDCMREQTRCDARGFSTPSGCGCSG